MRRSTLKTAATTALLFTELLVATGARADCPRPAVSWVALEFSTEAGSAAFRNDVVEHLRAGLVNESLDVCPHSVTSDEEPIALVKIRLGSSRSVTVTIDVRDGVTRKQVVRSLNLGALPQDGRALAVAVATDELLRASWAEIALRDGADTAAPEAVERAVRDSIRPEYSPKKTELGSRFALEHYGGGQTLVGADVALRHWFDGAFGAAIALGLRSANTTSSEHGDISGAALHGSIATTVRFLRTGWLGASGELGITATRLSIRGAPARGAVGTTETGTAAFARLGGSVEAWPGSAVDLAFRAGAGAPLRGVAIADDGVIRTGVSGLELYCTLGAGVAF